MLSTNEHEIAGKTEITEQPALQNLHLANRTVVLPPGDATKGW